MALDALLLLAEAAHLEEQPRLKAASHKRPRATQRCEEEEQDDVRSASGRQEVHVDGGLPRRSRRRPHPCSAAPPPAAQQHHQEAFSFGHRQERPVSSWSGFGVAQAASSVHSELSLGQWRGNAGILLSASCTSGGGAPLNQRQHRAPLEEPAHLQDDADSSTCSSASCACSSASTEDTANDQDAMMMIVGELEQEAEQQPSFQPPAPSSQAAADFSFPALWPAPTQVVLSW